MGLDLINGLNDEAFINAADREQSGEHILASATLEDIAPCEWHTLTLRFEDDKKTGHIDGKEAVSATSSQYPRGMAGLMAPLKGKNVCTPYFDNLRIAPCGRTAPTSPIEKKDVRPLFFCS